MGWFGRRSESARAIEAAATERLERLARQWRPPPSGPDAPTDGSGPAPPDPWQSVLSDDTGPRRIRVGPWGRPAVRALVILVSICLAVTAWWWWSGRPREVVAAPVVVATGVPIAGSTVEQSTSPSSTPVVASQVVVHVAGLVAQPGLITLPAGARVADAIAAAGGVTRKRAADSVNLARILVDGEQIVVSDAPAAASGSPPVASGPPVLDLNAADGAAFEGLPGVGPVLAGRILEWRTANGPFRSVDELGEVSGIGDATLARLRPLVRV